MNLSGPWTSMCAEPPEYELDPTSSLETIPELNALHGASQDPVHHAEGDVATHTRLVVQALRGLDAFRRLPRTERIITALACLLHDIAKPLTCVAQEDGRVGHPGHARKGARMTRRVLWQWGVPFAVREAVCGLVRLHEVPYFLIEKEDPVRMAIRTSMVARCDLLALVAQADVLGRRCEDREQMLENIALFEAQCEELGCLQEPFEFPSDHTRFRYFHGQLTQPGVKVWDDTRCEVLLMSGLPGAGKDTWLQRHGLDVDVISLDGIRHELGVDPADKQGQVVQTAQERAKGLLRKGQGFCWNATNISRSLRQRVIDLAAAYGARVRIVYVEAPAMRLFDQNRSREHAVPELVMERLLKRWEVPDRTEAHEVSYAVSDV